jgi:hypothetical protein
MWIERPRLFQYYYYYYYYYYYSKWLDIEACSNTSFAFKSDQNSCILITCDNTYIMESKDELVFVDFFVYLMPLMVCE